LQLTAGGGCFYSTHTSYYVQIFSTHNTQHSTRQLTFMEGGKPENPEKKPQSRGENHAHKLNSHTSRPSSGTEPGTVGVRGDALTADATPASLISIAQIES
jgi:hypothetical protein